MATIYRGKLATVKAINRDDVTIELAYNHQDYVIDWTDRAIVWTAAPTTVAKTVNSAGTLYLSEGWLTDNSIAYSGDPKHPLALGGIAAGGGAWPPVQRIPVPVTIESVTPRIAVLGANGALGPSAPVPPEALRGLLRERGRWSEIELSGRWLHEQGLLDAPGDGWHPHTVVRTGDDVTLKQRTDRGTTHSVNLDDTSSFAPGRDLHPGSPTDLEVREGADGVLGVSPDWLYRNA